MKEKLNSYGFVDEFKIVYWMNLLSKNEEAAINVHEIDFKKLSIGFNQIQFKTIFLSLNIEWLSAALNLCNDHSFGW